MDAAPTHARPPERARADFPRATISSEKGAFAFPNKVGRSNVMLNCAVQAADPQGAQYRVKCRHLATEYFLAPGKKANFLAQMTTREGIAQHFTGVHNDRLGLVVRGLRPEHRVLLEPNGVGPYLAQLAARVEKMQTSPKSANIMLCTATHARAVHIEQKQRKPDEPEAGSSYLVLKLYDPNCSDNHKRVEVARPQDLLAVSLGNQPMAALCREVPMGPEAGKFVARPRSEFLKLGLQLEMPEALQVLVNAAHMLSADDARACLSMRSGGVPLLWGAMNQRLLPWECGSVLRVFEAATRRLNLDPPQLCDALESQHNGMPALHAAMRAAQADSVREFGNALTRMDPAPDTLVRLLKAADDRGIPGLYMACARGHAEVVRACAEVLHCLGDRLSRSAKLDLFDALAPDGLTADAVALMNGHEHVLNVHAELRAGLAGTDAA